MAQLIIEEWACEACGRRYSNVNSAEQCESKHQLFNPCEITPTWSSAHEGSGSRGELSTEADIVNAKLKAAQFAHDLEFKVDAERARSEKLEREIRYLRHYGNKDCTAMADEAFMRGDLDEEASRD